MIRILIPGIFLSAVVLLLYSFSIKNISKPVNSGFAVVELFTSEGCSSCPPADEAVADIQKEYPDNVYVLGFHVDYWNYIGWKDIYSNTAFSRRQQEYGRHFSLSSIYTPQVIVNGETEFVGSDKSMLYKTVRAELTKNPGIQLALTAHANKNNITVNYTLDKIEDAVINFALVQSAVNTDVKGGENNGRKLHHINVVRDFKTVEADTSGEITFIMPANLNASDCKVVAYLQDIKDKKIKGVSSVKL